MTYPYFVSVEFTRRALGHPHGRWSGILRVEGTLSDPDHLASLVTRIRDLCGLTADCSVHFTAITPLLTTPTVPEHLVDMARAMRDSAFMTLHTTHRGMLIAPTEMITLCDAIIGAAK